MTEKYGFTINVDLIAGLTNETLDDFIGTLDAAAALNPDNITVHTLSRKNGSELKQAGIYDNCYVPAMTGYALEKLGKSGYIPYYLYRQKQMLGNLENVGYCKPGKQCINNITTMEDCMSVIACRRRFDYKGRFARRKTNCPFCGFKRRKALYRAIR